MRFSYYERLSPVGRAIYRESDRVSSIRLSHPAQARPHAEALQEALEAGRRPAVKRAASRLCRAVCTDLGVAAVSVEVLEVRPQNVSGELHGLYTVEPRRRARIEVWMRTAKQRRVVAFRTFLRTLVHELCHHLDYRLLGLSESFHTRGFFKRESSLVHQLAPAARRRRGVKPAQRDA